MMDTIQTIRRIMIGVFLGLLLIALIMLVLVD